MDFGTFLGSLARTVGAVASGVLISRGLPPEAVSAIIDPATQALTGALVYVGIQIWSLFEKEKKKSK